LITQDKLERLMNLNERIRTCMRCELWKTRTQAITGEGNPNSALMIIAQAPGYREDEEGRMFVGPSGGKLNELLEYAKIGRKDIYMTNLVKCLLPHYRRPKPREIESCSQYLDEEINIVNPRVIATLGYLPAKYIFQKYELMDNFSYSKICGKTFNAGDKIILPLRHPATLLYNPKIKEEMKENYKKIRTLLDSFPW